MGSGIEVWIRRLRAAAGPVLEGTPLARPQRCSDSEIRRYIDGFEDEYGHRRSTDVYLLAHLLKVRIDRPVPADEPWLEIWSMLVCDRAGVYEPRAAPPIAADPSCWAKEHETQRELASVHALWYHAQSRDSLRHALDRSARWLIDNVQPDNATNHPWALHVFVERSIRLGGTQEGLESAMYADQLYHNPLVARGSPDLLSAVIFWDAAMGLESTLS